MYIDGLCYELKHAGVWCHINGEFAGAFGYADDIYFYHIKHFITVCEDYATMFNTLLNPMQLNLMCFNGKTNILYCSNFKNKYPCHF